jgi:serine kinase of HPr protein (carbohydrate metabolism regulator)
MSEPEWQTAHASCVLVGRTALLIRGPAGSGKSRLVLALLAAARQGLLPFTRLVADDRVQLAAVNGRLVARAPAAIAGKIEVRGFGIRTVEHESPALVGLVVDLEADDAARMPEDAARHIKISGVSLSRLPVARGESVFPSVLAALSNVTDA